MLLCTLLGKKGDSDKMTVRNATFVLGNFFIYFMVILFGALKSFLSVFKVIANRCNPQTKHDKVINKKLFKSSYLNRTVVKNLVCG